MSDEEAFEEWKTCYQVNLKFYSLLTSSQAASPCMWCGSISDDHRDRHSTFAPSVAACAAGHMAKLEESRTCIDCEANLVERITKRKVQCHVLDCRRTLIVSTYRVRKYLGSDETLINKYFRLIEKYLPVTCLLCTEEIAATDLYHEDNVTPRCQHDPEYCQDCMKEYTEALIKGGHWKDIPCPEEKCSEILKGLDVRNIVSTEVYKIYDENVTRANLVKNPNFRWCYTNCGGGQLINGCSNMATLEDVAAGLKKSPSVAQHRQAEWLCLKCSKMNCFRCKKAKHSGATCEQGPTFALDDRVKRSLTKKCPARGCGMDIQFISGCAHMSCQRLARGCGIQFCWECKIIFPKNNTGRYIYKHLTTCPKLNGNLETNGSLPRPLPSDPSYAINWDRDPEYGKTIRVKD